MTLTRRDRLGLTAIVVAGGGWRFATLDVQSLWRDEAVTHSLMGESLPGLLSRLPDSESTPPLFYVLEWLWTRVAGLGEVGLRSLPALCGVLTILAAFSLAERLGGVRAGLTAAAVVAASPFAVWYAQEARAYALLGLLAVVSCTVWLDVLEARRSAWPWAACAAAAILTHYFAFVLVVPQALVLAGRALRRDRARVTAVAPVGLVALVGLALAPLAIAQQGTGNLAWLEEQPLADRLAGVPKHAATGPFGTPFDPLAVVLIALLVAGLGLALVRRPARPLSVLLAVAAIAAVVALPGYILDRNLLELVLPALVLAGYGLARLPGRASAVPALLVAGLAACTVTFTLDEELQREDWRAAAARLADGLIVSSVAGEAALELYRPALVPAPVPTSTSSVTYVTDWRFGRARDPSPPPPAPGWRLTARADGPTTTVVRFDGPPTLLDPAVLAGERLDPDVPAVVWSVQ